MVVVNLELLAEVPLTDLTGRPQLDLTLRFAPPFVVGASSGVVVLGGLLNITFSIVDVIVDAPACANITGGAAPLTTGGAARASTRTARQPPTDPPRHASLHVTRAELCHPDPRLIGASLRPFALPAAPTHLELRVLVRRGMGAGWCMV